MLQCLSLVPRLGLGSLCSCTSPFAREGNAEIVRGEGENSPQHL